MKLLKKNQNLFLSIFISLCISLFSISVNAKDIVLEIRGNDFTDSEVILSLIEKKPTSISDEYSNYLLKTLNNSKLFENVKVETNDNGFIISITEFVNINRIYFRNNERLDNEELLDYAKQLNLINMNPNIIDEYIFEVKKIYESFGYNNIEINYSSKTNDKTNLADLTFDITEGKITKIKNIIFNGNSSVSTNELKSIINSKTKTLVNIFANNNFKRFSVDNDGRLLKNYYINKGYIDIQIDYSIEFLKSNKVNLYFYIEEGDLYKYKDISFLDTSKILDKNLIINIDKEILKFLEKNQIYSRDVIGDLNRKISDLIIENGTEFFEIKTLEKKETKEISILFDIISIEPKYTNQINIYGNSRTFDRVIRRELELAEGDPIYKSQILRIQEKLSSLKIFKSVEVVEKEIDDNLVDLEINIEEKQTGTFNAGLSIGTIDGLGLVAGLSEKNFYGTGRSLNALINTTETKTQFTLETTDRLIYENNVDLTYKSQFKEEDFSVASSYKLDTFTAGVGISYDVNPKLRHFINLDYIIKDYKITNSSTVSSSILNSSGESVSFILSNNLFYSTLNSRLRPNEGRSISYTNLIETPTSSYNGLVKNVFTIKNFTKINKNIFSVQSRIGNILSLSGNDVLTDDKFSLGGRWLRGFDSYGAGPRNSRTSYVGGNNLLVTKFDFSRELSQNSDFPLYFNLFNDYGLVWENKTKPTNNDNTLRSSVGFGLKYYSPIGPIGFSWGFPIQDESYDIKRMFLFSVGNID